MSAPSETEVADALRVMLAAVTVPVYERDEVSRLANPPGEYVELSLQWRPGAQERAGRDNSDGYRFTTYAISGRSIDNARESLRQVSVLLRGERLSVSGRVSTPIRKDVAAEPDEQSGHFVAWADWTYVL